MNEKQKEQFENRLIAEINGHFDEAKNNFIRSFEKVLKCYNDTDRIKVSGLIHPWDILVDKYAERGKYYFECSLWKQIITGIPKLKEIFAYRWFDEADTGQATIFLFHGGCVGGEFCEILDKIHYFMTKGISIKHEYIRSIMRMQGKADRPLVRGDFLHNLFYDRYWRERKIGEIELDDFIEIADDFSYRYWKSQDKIQ